MVDLNGLVKRLKEVLSISTNEQLSKLLGLSPANFSKRKKSGTLLAPLIDIGISKNVNLDWLLTGKGASHDVTKKKISGCSETIELMNMTREIIDQDTEFSRSLKANIRMSYQALKAEERYRDLEVRMRQLEKVAAESYHPDRRKGERRTKNDPDAIPGNIDRRSGMDRRVAVTKP